MNPFLERSVELANNWNYLDLLFNVYPFWENENRSVDQRALDSFILAYKSKNDYLLIQSLLLLDKSPINNPYIALLRWTPNAIKKNPLIVSKVAKSIYARDLNELITQVMAPINSSRQMGPVFRNYLLKEDFPWFYKVNWEDFLRYFNSNKKLIVIDSDKNLKDISTKYFWYTRNKWIDFLAKIYNKIIIWEAKLFSINWGSQNNQMLDALSTLKQKALPCYVVPIAILDGACWFKSNSKLHTAIVKDNPQENIFSALFLKSFLESLYQDSPRSFII